MASSRYYNYTKGARSLRQCGSSVSRTMKAPVHVVWSVVRRFDKPQAYKRFVRNCRLKKGFGGVGSVREIISVSGVPDRSCIERLDKLDDESHLMEFSIVGGDNRLKNYRSTITLKEVGDGNKTEVVESYEVDVPEDSNEDDTCLFADAIIGFNLNSLATVVETLSVSSP